MRIIDKNGNELIESEIDLTLGYLSEGTAIKVDAEPIDNETKFAWADEDYETVQYYCLYADELPTGGGDVPSDDSSVWDELDAAYREGVDSV